MIKIYHYDLTSGAANFGDALNTWMWPRLAPDILRSGIDSESVFVGIGTLLTKRLQDELADYKRKIVFGTGYGYRDEKLEFDSSWKFYCVRGPLTARALDLDPGFAATDPASLLTHLIPPQDATTDGPAFMPHILQALHGKGAWQKLCSDLGCQYIDPRWSVEKVVEQIQRTDLLITEALHGAVVADSYRIPWVPVVSSDYILSFKWRDWCASLNLEYSPIRVPQFWGGRQKIPFKNIVGRARFEAKLLMTRRKLKSLLSGSNKIISSDVYHKEALTKLETAFERFINDNSDS